MEVKFAKKKAFTVIGKLRSSFEGPSFIDNAWNEFNQGLNEVLKFAKKDEDGKLVGVWGAMSNLDQNFGIWENNYSEGLYLASIEVRDEAIAPLHWTRWRIPEFNYAYVKVENNYSEVFKYVLGEFLPKNKLKLAGAVQEFYNPNEHMQLYLFFPVM